VFQHLFKYAYKKKHFGKEKQKKKQKKQKEFYQAHIQKQSKLHVCFGCWKSFCHCFIFFSTITKVFFCQTANKPTWKKKEKKRRNICNISF
jgi:hypothetical protein